MKFRHGLFVLLLVAGEKVFAQFQSETWIFGSRAASVQFKYDTILISNLGRWDSLGKHIREGWACANAENGELAFFSNGRNVYQKNGYPMQGDITLPDSIVADYFSYGIPGVQTMLALPAGNGIYYLFYYSVSDDLFKNSINGYWKYPNRLYYAVIDMNENGGMGRVMSIRHILYNLPFGDNRMTAVRHGNGRDWWLVVHGYNNNVYHKWLVTPTGISQQYEQTIGASFEESDAIGQAVFSPDGTKYASGTGKSPIVLLDFDRCTGEFSNPVNIIVQPDTAYIGPSTGNSISGLGVYGLAFSPNGRYLYCNVLIFLWQYDIQAQDVEASRKRIYAWNDSVGNGKLMCCGYLAANGKIYMRTWHGAGGPSRFHVIHEPDREDTACQFKVDEFSLVGYSENSTALSNVIHYHLRKWEGSGCDTLALNIEEKIADNNMLEIFPNPAKDKVVIALKEYLEDAELHIADVSGRKVYQTNSFYLEQSIGLSHLQAGVYFVEISNGRKKLVNRLVKE